MNEVFMVLLSFGLGILATVFTQIFTRRLKLSDVKRKQQIDDLHRVKAWIESYKILFECQYPEVHLGLFLDDKPTEDKRDSLLAHQGLRLFREASTKCDEARQIGRLALKSLAPSGLPNVIEPLIKELEKHRTDLFVIFPEQACRIDWDKLEFTAPTDVHLIVHHSGNWPKREEFYDNEEYLFMLNEAHRNLRVRPDDLWSIRRDARYIIESALEEIQKRERSLLVVPS